jgi:hypothetical protein
MSTVTMSRKWRVAPCDETLCKAHSMSTLDDTHDMTVRFCLGAMPDRPPFPFPLR